MPQCTLSTKIKEKTLKKEFFKKGKTLLQDISKGLRHGSRGRT
jgi:hypothetical protein